MQMPTDDNPVVVWEGDSAELLPQLTSGSVDLVATDPPYSARTHACHDSVAGRKPGDAGYDSARRKTLGYAPWGQDEVNRFVPEFARISSGWVLVMTDHTLAPAICAALTAAKRYVFAPLPFYAPGSRVRLSGDGPSSWTDWIIAARTAKQHRWGTLPGGYVAGPGWRDREHMGGKPVQLMRELVRDYSRKDDTVLDPFGGAGTTAVAAALEGRKCILIEKDPQYAAVARRRVAEVLGQNGLFRDVKPAPSADLFAVAGG